MAPRQISNKNHRSKNNNYIYLGKIRIDGEKEGKKYQILRFEIVLRNFHGGPIIESQSGAKIFENSQREQQKQFYNNFCYINYRASENLQQLVSILAPISDGQNLIVKVTSIIYKHNNTII